MRARTVATTVVVTVLAALAGCSLPTALTGDEAPPDWARLDLDGAVVTGPVEPYRPGHLIASGRLHHRDCILDLAVERVGPGGGATARCLPGRDERSPVPPARALSSNGLLVVAVEWQDMADATPPGVWTGDDESLSRESLEPGPDADATAFVDAGTSDDEAVVVGTAPSVSCPHGAVAAWNLGVPGLRPFGIKGPCVDASSASSLHADTGDAWLLVAGPLFAPGTTPSTDQPTQAWYATADDEAWATTTWHQLALPTAPELVTDVVVNVDGMLAGSRAGRPALLTISGDRATDVDVPDELLDADAPVVLVADPGTGSRPVVLAVQARSGVRVWTQRRDGWYAVAGPPGRLTSAVEQEGSTWLATRDDDGELALWVRRRTATDTSPPAYRAQP